MSFVHTEWKVKSGAGSIKVHTTFNLLCYGDTSPAGFKVLTALRRETVSLGDWLVMLFGPHNPRVPE